VLQAPPGAGKTTTVPLAMLLQEPHYLQPQQKILVRLKHHTRYASAKG
jgi:HrpA-like RNA helicase